MKVFGGASFALGRGFVLNHEDRLIQQDATLPLNDAAELVSINAVWPLKQTRLRRNFVAARRDPLVRNVLSVVLFPLR